MNQYKCQAAIIFIMAVFLFACDFTPPINRKIIDAQRNISEQKYSEAASLYEEILNKNLSSDLRLKISYQLGELYSIYLGKYKKAVYYYSEVKSLTEDPLWLIKIEEKLADIHFNYLKNYEEAIKNYKRLSEFNPRLKKYDWFQIQIAESYYKLGRLDEAVDQLNKIQSNQNNEYFLRSFYLLGLIYFEKKEYNKSLYVFSEFLKRETDKEKTIEAKFIVANIYESTDNLKLAYDIYYSLLKEYPNKEVIQNRLNSLYERRVARRR